MEIENTTFNGVGKVDPFLKDSFIECEQCKNVIHNDCLFFEGDYYCDQFCLVHMMIEAGVVKKIQ